MKALDDEFTSLPTEGFAHRPDVMKTESEVVVATDTRMDTGLSYYLRGLRPSTVDEKTEIGRG